MPSFAAFRILARAIAWSAAALIIAATARADLRVVGTDLLGVEASEALYKFSGRAELPPVLAFDGSRAGLDQLKAGHANLALLVSAPDESAGPAGFESLTLGQLRGVFGESGLKNLSHWGDLGMAGDFAASAIGTYVPAMGQGIMMEFFRQAVLQNRPFNATVARYATPAELILRLAGERRALALAPGPWPNTPGIKIVRVAVRANEPAFSPTPENLHFGDYPLALPQRIVFRREQTRALRPLLRFLFSEEFAPVLERGQVVPLAPAARQQQVAALEKA